MTKPAVFAALLALLGAAALAPPACADYRQKAEAQTDYIQAHLYDARSE